MLASSVTLFFSFVLATFVTMVLIPPLVHLAERLHAADVPSERKVHKTPMPRLGGVAMATGAVLPLIMWVSPVAQAAPLLAGIAIILFFGVWDDISPLDYRVKFLGQLLAVTVVIAFGDVVIRALPFGGGDVLPLYVAVPLTAFVLVGVTNAINLSDGLDGLAGGVTFLSLAAIAVLAYMTPDSAFLLLATISIMGSILGFLRYNTYPARIFMGDGGSQFLGFSAGVLAILHTQTTNTALSPALPLLILGLPILDTLLVMGERIYEGGSPFTADRKHIHHRLLALGFHDYEAVVAIYALQSCLIVASYLLRFESDALIVGLYAFFCAAIVAFLKLAPRAGWRLHGGASESRPPVVPPWVQWWRRDQRLLKVAFYAAMIGIPGFLLVGALFVASVPRDIGTLATVLLVVLLALYFRYRRQPFSIVEKAIAYVAGVFIVYLVQMKPGALAGLSHYFSILFVTMTVAVAIGFRVGRERFRTTPMDYLVVFIALVVPNLPGIDFRFEHMSIAVAMIIVLFYSIELVLNSIWRRWDVMRFTTYITLALLGVRGVMGM
jgi:UDP-GlcNAc:undecaprenyl-phosphate/decaprenyl-phosphate GlcNAc-1-phosphate transferase